MTRADFYLTQNQFDPAQANLNSAWEIIERLCLKLYAVDYLLIHGRYSLATADFDTALNHYQEGKNRIEEIGQWGLMPRWQKVSESECTET